MVNERKTVPSSFRENRMQDQKFIIGGEWQSGDSVTAVRNPVDSSEIARVSLAGSDAVDAAVRSAHEGFRTTAQYASAERSEILRFISGHIRSRKEEFARLITAESGKPITFSRAEVDRAVMTFEIAAEEATRIYGETIPLDISPGTKGRQGIVNRFPVGIVLCITPFNFPLNLVAHKIAPAIASGNAFILKPAPQTPLTSLLLGDIMLQSGLNKQSINIIPTTNELAESLVSDERIAMVSFTGSARVGWKVKRLAGKKKVTLELGGNAAVIVDASADLSHAVARCVLGGFGSAGQVCIKVQRIIVQDSVYDEFESRFVKAVQEIVTGNPAEDATVVGPLISESEAERVDGWVREAITGGCTVLTGGKRNGRYYLPTVLKDVTPSMKVCTEEIFGPVVTLEKFSTMESGVAMTNNSKYGLQAGIFSNDHRAIQYAYKHLQVGGVIVNDYPTFRVDSMPYGGVKDSGFGREGVRYAMEEMMEKKLLVL